MYIETYRGAEITLVTDELLALYGVASHEESRYRRGYEASTIIVIARDDERTIGMVRILSDLFQSAFLVDLWVDPLVRGEGVGSALLSEAVSLCQKEGIAHIQLITDPRYPWLVDFYRSQGFVPDPAEGVRYGVSPGYPRIACFHILTYGFK